jgi:hypothetical protein
MSKFLKLCERVERFLKEENGLPEFDTTPETATEPAPGQPVDPTTATLDPETQSKVKDVDNEKIEKLIEIIVDFYQKGSALSADSVNEINKLPSKINSENSEDTVDKLIYIFNQSNLPVDTSETNS